MHMMSFTEVVSAQSRPRFSALKSSYKGDTYHLFVLYVQSLSVIYQILGSTQEFIRGRNPLLVPCVWSPLMSQMLSIFTQEFILGRNHVSVYCVRSPLVIHQLFANTQEFTQGRNPSVVHCVRIPLVIHHLSGYTQEFIQVRKHSVDCFARSLYCSVLMFIVRYVV